MTDAFVPICESDGLHNWRQANRTRTEDDLGLKVLVVYYTCDRCRKYTTLTYTPL